MSRLIVAVSLLVLLNVSCQPDTALPGVSGVDLNPLLEQAASGSFDEISRLARSGGDGAWFALAAAAGDAGYQDLSRTFRIRSSKQDGPPFSVKSLTSLLIAEPDALRRPLALLRKAERQNGPDEAVRRARIVVLSFEGREELLADEMDSFTGQAWEAPVLAARLRNGGSTPEVTAATERFILHCPDPGALSWIAPVLPEDLSSGYRRLLEARSAFALNSYGDALMHYGEWLDSLRAEPEVCDLEAPPPVFDEMARAARIQGLRESWARILSGSSLELSGSRRYGAAFGAALLLLEMRDYRGAAEAFLRAAQAMPAGYDRDRAMRQMITALYRLAGLTTEEEIEAFSVVFGSWHDAAGFYSLLEEFLHRRVVRGEWVLLEGIFRERSALWPPFIRAQTALILAFAAYEGRLPAAPVPYLEYAASAAPLSWPGLRAAGILGRDPGSAVRPPDSGETLQAGSGDDREIRLYVDWGLTGRAAEAVLANPDLYNDETIRRVSRVFADSNPRLSIRIAGLVTLRSAESYTLEDLLLRYPLPLGSMPSEIAAEAGLPPELLLGIIRTESAWDERAVSRSGAMGLAQFMPSTWEEWTGRLKLPEDSDPMDPRTNLAMAAAYLEWLYLREWTFGWIDVLASYNAGGGRVRAWRQERPGFGDDLFGMSIPLEEPRSYIFQVLSAATLYGYLYAGESPGSLHEEWGLEMIEVN